MAWVTTKKFEYAVGNHKCQHWDLTADAATLELDTGLGVVDSVVLNIASGASAPVLCKKNVLSAGTASNGYVAITGAASGDDFYITVWGH